MGVFEIAGIDLGAVMSTEVLADVMFVPRMVAVVVHFVADYKADFEFVVVG